MTNGINDYSLMMFDSGPVKVSDFLSDVPNKVHTDMLNNAIEKFYEDHQEFKDNPNVKIIEIKEKEFWQCPSIKVIDYSTKPLKSHTFSLKKYWDNIYVEKNDEGSIPSNIGSNNDELYFIDYIHGKATMIDRHTNNTYKVDFSDIGQDVAVNDDFYVYPTTFKYKQKYDD